MAVEAVELEEGFGEEMFVEIRENGLEECVGEFLLGDLEMRRVLGSVFAEDGV